MKTHEEALKSLLENHQQEIEELAIKEDAGVFTDTRKNLTSSVKPRRKLMA